MCLFKKYTQIYITSELKRYINYGTANNTLQDSGYHQLLLYIVKVELHLFGKFGAASHPDMKNIWIIGFLCENRLH
jgi:hypothetical protein